MDRYDHALAAGLVILGELDRRHDMPRHERLALLIFAIIHAMVSHDSERMTVHASGQSAH